MSDLPTIAIAGAAGRMGRALATGAAERGFLVTGATESGQSSHIGAPLDTLAPGAAPNVKLQTDPVSAAEGARVWIDFTTPAASIEALHALRHSPVTAIIIGTTGFTDSQMMEVEKASADFAIVKAGNFSLGVAMLCALVEQTASRLVEGWDIEILESHHRRKMDAPSGTALMVGEAAAKGRGGDLSGLQAAPYDGREAKREPGNIGFAVRRAGGVIGEHEAMFASEKEILRLSHTALDRSVFVDGALQAAAWAADREPGLYSVNDVLGL